jgi:hypothetical protein
MEDCHVGDPGGVDLFAPHPTCRRGYTCAWDGIGGVTASVNGACVPGELNAVRVDNIGAACTSGDTCFSPYGAGRCDASQPGGYCTVTDCAAPGIVADVCGARATCAEVDPEAALSECFVVCTTATDCRAGYACIEVGGSTRVCHGTCAADADCRATERCRVAAGEPFGTCL